MRYFLIALSILFFFGCKEEKVTKPIAKGDLNGQWDIYHVTRNGKVTKTLENGYLLFQDDNTVKSNIFSDEKYHIFRLEQNKIEIDDLESLNFFDVKSLSNDTLILDSKINVFDMKFFLKKK
jgi:hypothetical protein